MTSIAEIQARKKALRKQMRQRRRSLSKYQQIQASKNLYRNVVRSAVFRFAKRVTFTLARDGEISPHLLLAEAQRRGKQCYLPVMSSFGHDKLSFRRVEKDTSLHSSNPFSIPEPLYGKFVRARALSLVLLPLVAFDADGNRLGMGKGFYDHTFAFLRRSSRRRPLLIGLAHECQRAESLDVASWDVPLQAIVTDQRWYTPKA